MFPSYDRTLVKRLILARIEAGWTLAGLAAEPGFPSAPTVRAWARGDEGFRQGLAFARDWRRGLRVEQRAAGRAFSPAWGEAFLRELRRGRPMRALVGGPGQATRRDLSAWRRADPGFDAAVAGAVRAWWGGGRRGRTRYDEAVADRVTLSRAKGATLAEIYGDPALPGKHVILRWRRLVPEFDGALRIARLRGGRVRKAVQRKPKDPALVEAIADHILWGGSLRSASRRPGMPHRMTLSAWMRDDPAFAERIELAKRLRDDLIADRLLDAAQQMLPARLAAFEPMFGAVRLRAGQLAGGRKRRRN